MITLLFRLAGPIQSWGTQSRFEVRDAGREPSKSGVVGLLCAALGRPRDAPLDDLVSLRMGVRVDHEGRIQVDYQTAGGAHRRGETYGVARASGSTGGTVVSRRYFLSDASFLVGLEGTTSEQMALLQQIDAALIRPVWPLFLGRKAFVPGESVRLPAAPPIGPSLRDVPLDAALAAYPWPDQGPYEDRRLRCIVDAEAGSTSEQRSDVPLSFVQGNRRFATRFVSTRLLSSPTETTGGPQ